MQPHSSTRPFRSWTIFVLLMLLFLVACGPAVPGPAAPSSPAPTEPAPTEPAPTEPGPTEPPYPPPYPTPAPHPTEWVPPTPTIPPAPTLVPTPVVTPIPTAAPPIIPDVVGKQQQPFWIYYWQGNEVWRVDDQGQNRELLLDTYKSLGQWLTAHPMAGTDCCWSGARVVASPDGGKLALVVVDKDKLAYKGEPFTFSIYVFDVASRSLSLVSEGVQPVWSPDSQRVVFLKERGLWIAELMSGQARERVAQHDNPEMHITEFAWSPDTTQIAYVYNFGTYQRIPEIWLVHTDDDTPPRQLLNQSYSVYGVTWSPDSRDVLFLSQEGGRDTSSYHSVRNLWSVSVATGERTQLTREMVVDTYIISPNKQWLFISGYHLYERSEESYDRDLWLLSLDSRELRRITIDLGSVGAAGWSPDGTRLVVWRQDAVPLLLSLESGTTIVVNSGLGSTFVVGGLK